MSEASIVVDIQTISIAIASAGVFVAAVYYIFQLRNQVRIRKIDLVTRLVSTFNSKEFAEASFRVISMEFRDYDDFVKKYGHIPSPNPDQIASRIVGVFYEQVGVLLRNGLIEPDLVFDLFSVKTTWEKVKPVVESLRKQTNQSSLFQSFEYLYNEEEKRAKSNS